MTDAIPAPLPLPEHLIRELAEAEDLTWPVVEIIVSVAVDHAHEALQQGTLTEMQAVHLDAAHSLYWRLGQALDTAREDGTYTPTYLLALAGVADNLAIAGGHQHLLLPHIEHLTAIPTHPDDEH